MQTYYHTEAPQRKISKERTLSENSDEFAIELAPEDIEKVSFQEDSSKTSFIYFDFLYIVDHTDILEHK